MPRLAEVRKTAAFYVTQPLLKLLAGTRLTPNMLTWTGFLITAVAGYFIVAGRLPAAGATVLVAGLFDMLDGGLARLTNQATRFGAALDSTLDRLAELVIFLALLFFFRQSAAAMAVTSAALAGSLLVSYVRARAEGLDLDCKVGVLTRSERVVILALGLLLSGLNYVLIAALLIIAALSLVTVVQRLSYIKRHTSGQ
ncbi:MAG: CDP-alcohol phosphatidyltransferase family protein [Chloroflexi bacterium]|nr:CDP-alcohol phosphatidyltransferase family protein [Chloroflexota bacterium]